MQATLNQSVWRPILLVALVTASILCVPLIAMQFTAQVNWTPGDFVVAFVLLFGTGLAYVLIVHNKANRSYRAAVGLALFAALFLIWANLAVGIIGDEGNRANLMYVAVPATGIVGSIISRLRPLGMACTLSVMAISLALIAVIALVGNLGEPSGGPLEIVMMNGFFIVLFLGAAWLFRRAARSGTGSA